MAKQSGYFTTGEFARLCNVEKSTLFYYDQIGLFSPERISENGYRYYSSLQFEEFETISMFRYTGMSIDEIKEYLQVRTPERYIAVLEEKVAETEEKIRELESMRDFMKIKIGITKESWGKKLGSISIQEAEEQYYFTTPETLAPTDDADYYAIEAEHMYRCRQYHVKSPYPVGERYYFDQSENRPIEHALYFKGYHTRLIEKAKIENLVVKPKGRYLICYHNEGYEARYDYIRRMLAYAEQNDLRTDCWIYEDTIVDEMSLRMEESPEEEPWIIKLTIRLIE